MTLRMYADRKKWPLEAVRVELAHGKVHAKDCEDCESKSGRIDIIERRLRLEGPLDDDQRQRLLEIADRCPVHRTLTSGLRSPNGLECRARADGADRAACQTYFEVALRADP